MKLKKAEAYIDTVVTVFINLIILYLVINLFSYMITYQKLNHAADNIIRCAAINGTTDTGVLGEDINEYITNEGFDRSKVTVSFDGTEYMSGSTEAVQFGDTILLNVKTNQSFKFIGRTGSSLFSISINKTFLSEKYHQNTNSVIIEPIIPEPVVEIKRNGVIPESAVYYTGGELCDYCSLCYGVSGVPHGPMIDSSYTFTNTPTAVYSSGDNFPAVPSVGDIYVEGDFIYDYFSSGWHVRAAENKSTYGAIVSKIAGKPVNNLEYTFFNCTSLTTAPTIPNSVTIMSNTFEGCTSLATAPTIPNSVEDMNYTFRGCTSLTTAPTIPSGVTGMSGTFESCTSLVNLPDMGNSNSITNMFCTFYGCTSLIGTVEINANPSSYDSCFYGTVKPITLTGTSTKLTELASTSNNGNVTVAQ